MWVLVQTMNMLLYIVEAPGEGIPPPLLKHLGAGELP